MTLNCLVWSRIVGRCIEIAVKTGCVYVEKLFRVCTRRPPFLPRCTKVCKMQELYAVLASIVSLAWLCLLHLLHLHTLQL